MRLWCHQLKRYGNCWMNRMNTKEYKDMATARALGKLLITNMLKQDDEVVVEQQFALPSI